MRLAVLFVMLLQKIRKRAAAEAAAATAHADADAAAAVAGTHITSPPQRDPIGTVRPFQMQGLHGRPLPGYKDLFEGSPEDVVTVEY